MKRKIILLRHAKTQGNLEKRYVGSTDEGILPSEKEFLQKLSKHIRFQENNNFIITSLSKRCIETCSFLFDGRHPDMTSEGLREMNFGDFEYKNFQELEGNPDYQKYIDSYGESPFPNGESKREFIERVRNEFLSILTKVPQDERTLFFIVHGGTIMAILSEFALPKQDYFSYHAEPLSGFQGILDYDNTGKLSVKISAISRLKISKKP